MAGDVATPEGKNSLPGPVPRPSYSPDPFHVQQPRAIPYSLLEPLPSPALSRSPPSPHPRATETARPQPRLPWPFVMFCSLAASRLVPGVLYPWSLW